MVDGIKNLFSYATKVSLNKGFILFSAFILSLIIVISAIKWIYGNEYELLLSNIPTSEKGDIIKVLNENSIDYKILPSTGEIMVTSAELNSARMYLAKKGLPSSYKNSYELLMDNQGVYTSEMNERIINKKIIEENIRKAILTIRGIERAEIQLALPKTTEFMQKTNDPTASIVLVLSPGYKLAYDQVQGITHLVAASVPHMKEKNVMIVDQTGQLLTVDEDSAIGKGLRQLRYKMQYENHLTKKISSVLVSMLGKENIRVSVQAMFDFDNKENTTENIIPNPNAIQSSQTEKTTENDHLPKGPPGALSNTPPVQKENAEQEKNKKVKEQQLETTHQKETYNYALGKSITHTDYSRANIKKISITLLVNDKPVKENDKIKWVHLSQDVIEDIKSLTKGVVGFDEKRGDTLVLSNQKFAEIKVPKVEEKTTNFINASWFIILLKGITSIVVLLVISFMGRSWYARVEKRKDVLYQRMQEEKKYLEEQKKQSIIRDEASIFETIPKDIHEKYEKTKQEVVDMVEKTPEKAAAVIKNWLENTD